MPGKLKLVALLLLIQACVSIVAQTPAPEDSVSEGVLQRASETYRAAKVKAQRIREAVQAFAGAYYEDHIKPVADPYIYMDWASASTSSFWDRVKEKIDQYRPI
ncbi:apolipoprotein C-IV [Oncorhynchus tshawytscha]|uniref:apolipoprotein C-IV n=1 Tax=Oncorhynchus tshawytscha TaxID=74940 RepID=UPI001C3D34B7|nr:apolipoprotein C-IV [Oncorhynchus tshawytscha]